MNKTTENLKQTMTVSSLWVRAMLNCTRQLGLDTDRLASAANLDMSKVTDPEARITMVDTLSLWRLIEEEEPVGIGLRIGELLSPAHFPLLAMNLIHSKSILDALRIASRYTVLVSEGAGLDIFVEGDLVSIRYQPRLDDFSHHQIDAVLAFVIRFGNWLSCREVIPVRVELNYEEPKDTELHKRVFKSPLLFNQPQGAVVYRLIDVMSSLPSSDPNLAELHEKLINEQMERIQLPKIVIDVREYLADSEDLATDRESVAKQLCVSGRTLQRKLQEAGTSYQQLLDEERERRAIQMLSRTQLSLQAISDALGFSESSTFTRAFKRWQGITPQQYRKR